MPFAAGDRLPDGAADALRLALRDVLDGLALSHPDAIATAHAVTQRPGWRPWWDRQGGGSGVRGRDNLPVDATHDPL